MNFDEIDREARERLKAARMASGKHPDQLCIFTGHSPASYYDVENVDSELTYCLDLQDVKGLCAEIGVSIRELFNDPSVPMRVSPEMIARKIEEHIANRNISLGSFEDEVGYYILSALKDPESIWKDWNIECLRNVCVAVGLNWIDLFE